jgi:hypothetical protein
MARIGQATAEYRCLWEFASASNLIAGSTSSTPGGSLAYWAGAASPNPIGLITIGSATRVYGGAWIYVGANTSGSSIAGSFGGLFSWFNGGSCLGSVGLQATSLLPSIYCPTACRNNLVSNGGFETSGTGGSDTFANWTESPSTTGSIIRTTTASEVHSGCAAAKLVGQHNTNIYKLVTVTPLTSYCLTFWAAGSGGSGRYVVRDWTQFPDLVYPIPYTYTGAGSTYAEVRRVFTTFADCTQILVGFTAPAGSGGTAWVDDVQISRWPLTGTTVGSLPWSLNAWHHLQVGIDTDAASGTIDVRIDGIRQLYYSGSEACTGCPVTSFAIGSGSDLFYGVAWNDFVVNAGEANEWPGALSFVPHYPETDSASVQFDGSGSHSDRVADCATGSPDSASYVSASAEGLIEAYGSSSAALPAGNSITALLSTFAGAKSASESALTLAGYVASGSSTASGMRQSVSASFGQASAVGFGRFTTDPDTGSAWSASGATDAYWGYMSAGSA